MHVATFTAKAGIAEAEWRATANGGDPGSWSEHDRLVLGLADALRIEHEAGTPHFS